LLDVFWTMLWFFLFFIWIWILIQVFIDIFRSDDMGGWGKAGWTIFVIFLPLLGVLVYLIARGRSMGERNMREAQRQEKQFRQYVQEAASSDGGADQLAKLADLHSKGVLTDEEFAAQKAKILNA
jgi:hypothetical protein